MSGPATCSWCYEPVLWCITRKGKNIPLNPEPDQLRGTHVLRVSTDRRGTQCYTVRRRDSRYPEDTPLYVCHFDTCEYAVRPGNVPF